ncbi:MAG: SDR family oxidoreductase [Candidatus Tectomicrobia bacterium]|nr:SDR family oxidoreductase [Candidatus Tectomicrobia bacterium]
MRLFDLSGKTAIVTGGTAGIGLAIAQALGEAGARVVLAGRSGERGREAVGKLTGAGVSAEFRPCDVTDASSVSALVNGVVTEHGGLHAMVIGAGLLTVKPALDFTAGEVDALLAVHLRGGFLCAQAAARAMIPRGGGKILFISSILAERAVPNQAPYIAAKGGMVARDPQKMAGVLARTPAGRAGEPEDVMGAAVFLCAPASDYLTGQHIMVDGGRSAGA